MYMIEAEAQSVDVRLPHVLLGPGLRRRQRSSVLMKLEIMRQMVKDGSSEVASNSLQRTKGISARLDTLQNDLYSTKAIAHMNKCMAISVYFDQSTHGGHDMNVGFVCSADGDNRGAYLRPAAPHLKL